MLDRKCPKCGSLSVVYLEYTEYDSKLDWETKVYKCKQCGHVFKSED
jgi:DNA-directed RNA polymerase subunit M/transcription elongation factor TFIIS